jgi:hypothetical protein
MKHIQTFCGLLLLAAIGGCNQSTAPTPTPNAANTPATPPAAAKSSQGPSDAQLKQIAASGKTGLWSEPSNLCGKTSKPRALVALAWNVPSTAPARFTLYRIGKDGKEHRIARGGLVGGRTISASTQAANVYILRNQAGKEMGRVQVDGKQC